MKFDCKDLEISFDQLGCTVVFGDRKVDYSNITDTDEIMRLSGTEEYVLLQRTFPEDDYDTDYSYIEFSDFDKSGELDDFIIEMSRNNFKMTFQEENIDIRLNINNNTFKDLKKALKIITNNRGKLTIKE